MPKGDLGRGRLRLHLAVAIRRTQLDRKLAQGADPTESQELALRARQLSAVRMIVRLLLTEDISPIMSPGWSRAKAAAGALEAEARVALAALDRRPGIPPPRATSI
jgi:hypothetical protein